MKLSVGLDVIMRWRWSTDDLRRYSDHVLDLFSPHRVGPFHTADIIHGAQGDRQEGEPKASAMKPEQFVDIGTLD